MAWTSILAIYFLIWVMSAFIMLPFGVRTAEEIGVEQVPGQAESAPANFRPGKLMIRATLIAVVLTTLYVLNYERGWITVADIDILPKPPPQPGEPHG
jgi:predicted secreted protein